MSERAQALEAAFRAGFDAAQRWGCDMESEAYADWASAAPPVGVSPQPDAAMRLRDEVVTRVLCVPFYGADVRPHGAYLLLDDVMRAVERPASLAPVEPTPEPPPDAQVCVWREREWDYESGCRGTQISRDERSSGPPDGWKHCPYCGKRLVVGTAPQGGEQ